MQTRVTVSLQQAYCRRQKVKQASEAQKYISLTPHGRRGDTAGLPTGRLC